MKKIYFTFFILLLIFVSGCIGGTSKEEINDMIKGCENISSEYKKNSCYKNISISLRNEEICQRISDNNTKIWCVAVVNGDADKCDEMKRTPESCYIEVAVNTKNPKICEKKLTGTIGKLTKDTCFFSVAVASENKNTCDKVVDNDKKNLCYATITK
ncbi:MAG: hypothetical protein DRJ01_16230, partial [Bacteroidetes bacterium]